MNGSVIETKFPFAAKARGLDYRTRDTISLKARNGHGKPMVIKCSSRNTRRYARPIEILITLALLIVRVPRIISFNHFNYLLHVIKHGLLHSC